MSQELFDLLRHEIHYIALAIMGTVYIAKIIWIMSFKPMRERTPSRGSESAAIRASFFCLFMPWTMESTSRKWYKWLEFAIFHVGIALAITASFLVSFNAYEFLALVWVNSILLIFFGASFIITLIRVGRRLFSPVNRAISHPDDYFSISMMVVWFCLGFMAFYPGLFQGNLVLGIYLATTAFLIAYVPFSKMSHYIMWPFSRYYFGKHFGHRGTYPKVKEL